LKKNVAVGRGFVEEKIEGRDLGVGAATPYRAGRI